MGQTSQAGHREAGENEGNMRTPTHFYLSSLPPFPVAASAIPLARPRATSVALNRYPCRGYCLSLWVGLTSSAVGGPCSAMSWCPVASRWSRFSFARTRPPNALTHTTSIRTDIEHRKTTNIYYIYTHWHRIQKDNWYIVFLHGLTSTYRKYW